MSDYPFENLKSCLSRREFLKFWGLSMAGLMLPSNLLNRMDVTDLPGRREWLWGRVLKSGCTLYQAETTESDVIGELAFDSVYQITNVLMGRDNSAVNKTWYQLGSMGYVHSRWIQPVRKQLNQPVRDISKDGWVGEVTFPFVDAFTSIDKQRENVYRLYYASTIWVLNCRFDEEGNAWYEFLDDLIHRKYYVPAHCIRLVSETELTGLSPQVPFEDKHLMIDLEKQLLTAFVKEKEVTRMRISTGIRKEEGGFATPKGIYRTGVKRPCRHIFTPPSEFGSGFDLPGVPWLCYFTIDGVALHGTYWHNDFGVPNSHGCINLRPEDAKWVYRWTTPTVPSGKYYYADDQATRIVIQ